MNIGTMNGPIDAPVLPRHVVLQHYQFKSPHLKFIVIFH